MVYINEIELIIKHITNDVNAYKKEDLKTKYKVSKYKYKDDLYKELLELADI